MNQFESGSLVAIADVPADLVGKVVQGQPVRIVQTYIGDGAEVLVEGLNHKEYPIAVGNLCSLKDSCKARAAQWFICDTLTHRESLAAYEQVVEDYCLGEFSLYSDFDNFDIVHLSDLFKDLKSHLMGVF